MAVATDRLRTSAQDAAAGPRTSVLNIDAMANETAGMSTLEREGIFKAREKEFIAAMPQIVAALERPQTHTWDGDRQRNEYVRDMFTYFAAKRGEQEAIKALVGYVHDWRPPTNDEPRHKDTSVLKPAAEALFGIYDRASPSDAASVSVARNTLSAAGTLLSSCRPEHFSSMAQLVEHAEIMAQHNPQLREQIDGIIRLRRPIDQWEATGLGQGEWRNLFARMKDEKIGIMVARGAGSSTGRRPAEVFFITPDMMPPGITNVMEESRLEHSLAGSLLGHLRSSAPQNKGDLTAYGVQKATVSIVKLDGIQGQMRAGLPAANNTARESRPMMASAHVDDSLNPEVRAAVLADVVADETLVKPLVTKFTTGVQRGEYPKAGEVHGIQTAFSEAVGAKVIEAAVGLVDAGRI
ncbi:Uncharacterised protein [uncultured archaeon]|nr:Uncharacterised protein [uncultured archaeon]